VKNFSITLRGLISCSLHVSNIHGSKSRPCVLGKESSCSGTIWV